MSFENQQPVARLETRLHTARVRANQMLCREHFRLTVSVAAFDSVRPGQFVHLGPLLTDAPRTQVVGAAEFAGAPFAGWNAPLLRRAFSVAGLKRFRDRVDLDVIYRVVGRGTRWLASLHEGDELSLLGPLGREFPISSAKKNAWMVAGGVGLPPMLYLAEALRDAGRDAVAFCGAQSRDLLPLSLSDETPPSPPDVAASRCVAEFARFGFGAVISTDDGSLGFHGHIGAALSAYADAHPPDTDDLIVYTCGPERMMQFVAEFCAARSIECYVCMERAMACGTGMCQSCVVPVHDEGDPSGWVYRLCCTDGPVFHASAIVWDPVGAAS